MTYDKAKLIPLAHRSAVARGERLYYRLTRPDYDRVPLDTFLVRCLAGTGGMVPASLLRVVKPNDPGKYAASKLTPGNRLLYACWRGGMAVKSLQDARLDVYWYVIYPDEPEHAKIAAFKVACDAKRMWRGRPAAMNPALLLEALGIDPDDYHRFDIDRRLDSLSVARC